VAGLSGLAAKIAPVQTFSIREAAERCAVSYQAMRRRVDRGSVQALTTDGVRRIPRSELERVGLWPGAKAGAPQEVQRLQAELERARGELRELRLLPQRVDAEREARERIEQAFHREHAERREAELAGEKLSGERGELRCQLDEIASAGPIRALRLRRKLRAG